MSVSSSHLVVVTATQVSTFAHMHPSITCTMWITEGHVRHPGLSPTLSAIRFHTVFERFVFIRRPIGIRRTSSNCAELCH